MAVRYGWRVQNAQVIVWFAPNYVLPRLFPGHLRNLLFWILENAFFVGSVLKRVHLKLFSEQVIIEWPPASVKTSC